MPLMIREFLDADITEAKGTPLNLQEGQEFGDDPIDPDSLMVEVEGIHAYPHATRNYTRYMPKALKGSIPSWTKPYRRPVILHHNEKNGRTIGRIVEAAYKTNKTLSGTPALLFTVNIPGEEDKKDIQSGIDSTTSIGVMAHDVRCSICGKQIVDENGCEEGHHRGEIYLNEKTGKNETCYWDIYSMEAKELSYVIVPSDIYSKNINIYPATKPGGKKPEISESADPALPKPNKGDSEMEEKLKELTEAKEQLEKQVAELKEAQEKSEGSIKELTEAKEKAEAKVKELEEAKAKLESDAKEEQSLKEGLESELAETKKALRESRIDEMQYLRKATGRKELDKEIAESRSDDFVRDSIIDMKEELAAKDPTPKAENLPKPGAVKNPTLVNDTKEINESHEDSEHNEIDLESGLKSLFNGVFRARS